jgi:hypothetical protein
VNPEDEKKLAKSYFNECWDLIEKADRTPLEDAQMLHLAHASRLHWDNVGGDLERAIGEWQCSRVNALLGFSEAALLHARLSKSFSAAIPQPHFVHASAAEGLAFAYFVSGKFEDAKQCKVEALELLIGVNEKDASHIRDQIEQLPF